MNPNCATEAQSYAPSGKRSGRSPSRWRGWLMRGLIALWLAPLVLFWGWFGLSFYDLNFGYVLLTRQAHDLIFQLYGEILGIDPEIIPSMLIKACVFDGLIVLAIIAFRRRRAIAAWARACRERYFAGASSPRI